MDDVSVGPALEVLKLAVGVPIAIDGLEEEVHEGHEEEGVEGGDDQFEPNDQGDECYIMTGHAKEDLDLEKE